MTLVSLLSAVAVAAGCADDADTLLTNPDPSPGTPVVDGGPGPDDEDAAPDPDDAGADAGRDDDACADGGCVAPNGCAAFPEASFCDDFDRADALTAGKTRWDFIEPTDQPVATLSSARAVSAPSSLLSRVIDRDTPGAKFAKTVTKANFTEVTWSYDVYLDSIGNEDGFFLDDFQFSDAAGPDTFGFRLVMFAQAGAINELKVEHNRQVNGGSYVIEPALAAGTVELGKWHHFEQTVKFTFASGEDAGGDAVEYTLRIDGAAAPVFQAEYPGATREQVAFARIAGLPLVFNKERSAGLAIHWDNHVLELK
ncbi:MAG: hypothetical protein KF782_09655 [Labilithrix sp.]|nr:hypothetical protein [Labilithrix sp.]